MKMTIKALLFKYLDKNLFSIILTISWICKHFQNSTFETILPSCGISKDPNN